MVPLTILNLNSILAVKILALTNKGGGSSPLHIPIFLFIRDFDVQHHLETSTRLKKFFGSLNNAFTHWRITQK